MERLLTYMKRKNFFLIVFLLIFVLGFYLTYSFIRNQQGSTQVDLSKMGVNLTRSEDTLLIGSPFNISLTTPSDVFVDKRYYISKDSSNQDVQIDEIIIYKGVWNSAGINSGFFVSLRRFEMQHAANFNEWTKGFNSIPNIISRDETVDGRKGFLTNYKTSGDVKSILYLPLDKRFVLVVEKLIPHGSLDSIREADEIINSIKFN